MHVKYAFRHWLYSVPNVFVVATDVIVVARGVWAERAGVATVWRGVAVRTTERFVALRDVAVVDALRDVFIVTALRGDDDASVVVASRAVVVAERATVVRPPRDVDVWTAFSERRDTGAVVVVARAITVGVDFADWGVAPRDTDCASRTAASACMMPMQHSNVKIQIRFIPVYYIL